MATGTIAARTSALEWIAAGVGLALLLAVLGVIGREALAGESSQPASIAVVPTKFVALDHGYLVEFEAINRSSATAAAVTIEGKVESGADPETATATLDYVAGHARSKGGLFFTQDPRGRLQLRALGYQEP